MAMSEYHVPVLLEEALDALAIRPDGVYVDCTFGGGGHSLALLERLGPGGRLVAFDQDQAAAGNLPADDRVLFVPQNFRHLSRFLRFHKIEGVDGILADLGVSSHQFDDGERGFSTRFEAALDMRMDQRQTLTAADVLTGFGEQELHKLFERYGEVTNARTLAKRIVEARKMTPLSTISGFKQAVQGVVKGNPKKYFAQVFQALRIEVNDELGALRELLEQAPGALNTGGRMAVITFHSLEDRLVKNFFKMGAFEAVEDENPFEHSRQTPPLKVITKKPLLPSDEEVRRNPRSRSAKLRVAEKS
jgi:16S rRNA (cytosine1402-N4)-methyltransferase